jgi:hypothetical protein
MGGKFSADGEERGVHRVLVGKPEGKRPLGRHRRGWKDNIKMDLQEVGVGCADWMELAQNRQVAGTCEYGKEHLGSIKMWGISRLAADWLASQEGLRCVE